MRRSQVFCPTCGDSKDVRKVATDRGIVLGLPTTIYVATLVCGHAVRCLDHPADRLREAAR